jgi:hypothetical protein
MGDGIGGRIAVKVVLERGMGTRPWTSPACQSLKELDVALRRQGSGLQINLISSLIIL